MPGICETGWPEILLAAMILRRGWSWRLAQDLGSEVCDCQTAHALPFSFHRFLASLQGALMRGLITRTEVRAFGPLCFQHLGLLGARLDVKRQKRSDGQSCAIPFQFTGMRLSQTGSGRKDPVGITVQRPGLQSGYPRRNHRCPAQKICQAYVRRGGLKSS